MTCPACRRRRLFSRWETGKGYWWSGRYECPRCGAIKASGTIKNGIRQLTYWHPACSRCGLDPVVRHEEQDGVFTCTQCGARIISMNGVTSRHFRGTRKDERSDEQTILWDGIAEAAL